MTIDVTELADGVCCITFNAPERLNAFSFDMYEMLLEHLKRISYDTTIRTVIITGSGRGFCSGHFAGGGDPASWLDPDLGPVQTSAAMLRVVSQIPVIMHRMPQPIIAAVNGAAAGIGYGIALSADIAIAAASAKFVNAYINAGTGHELGFSYLLPRAIGSQRAAELLLTKRPVLAEEAARIGLVLKTVPDEDLITEALTLAKAIAVGHPMGTAMTKLSFHLNQGAVSLETAIELENRAVCMVQATEDLAEIRRVRKDNGTPTFTNR